MGEGYLAFDKNGRLVDHNGFARTIFPGIQLNSWTLADFAGAVQLQMPATAKDFNNHEFQMGGEAQPRHFQMFTFDISDNISQYCGNGFIINETTEFRRRLNDLHIMATVDPLTGAKNRRSLPERMKALVEHAATSAQPLSILMFDIDHFKRVNDTYGHAVGDVVLTHIARLGSSSLRSNDEFYRYGGEEFLVLSEGMSEKVGKVLAERLRSRIEAEPLQVEGKVIPLTISAGCMTVVPSFEHATATELCDQYLKLVDDCLYEAKEDGRNRVVYCSSNRVQQTCGT
jgi:diguanylate cyclase (GGDEF)-like protein